MGVRTKRRRPLPSGGGAVQIAISPRALESARKWAWRGIIVVLALYLAWVVRGIWLPLAIAFLIAMVLDPVVDGMEARGWSRLKGSLVIFLSFFILSGVVLYFAIPAVMGQAQDLTKQMGQYLPTEGNEARAHKALGGALARSNASPWVTEVAQRGADQLTATITRSGNWISAHAMEVLSNLIWVIIIPIVTFYALKDFHLILAKLLLLVPRGNREFVQTVVTEVSGIFASFIRGLFIVSAMNGVATWVLLLMLRTPNALMLGVVAGVLYSVPYLGALLTIVLVAAVAFLSGGVQYMLLVVALNVILHQFLFDYIITPRILGGHVGLHPILSIVALLSGNLVLGIVGMLLAVPVAASIQMIVLTLVPKLAHEIAIPADSHQQPDTVESLSQETKAQHVQRDAVPDDPHRTVSDVVQEIEAKVEEETLAAEAEAAEAEAAEVSAAGTETAGTEEAKKTPPQPKAA